MKERRQLYEGMFILKASLSDDARQRALERIQEQISERQGEVHKVHDWGKRRLAYRIDGNREGFYLIIYFTAPTHAIEELRGEYPFNEDLIRFMTLRTNQVIEEFDFKPVGNGNER